MSDTGPLNYLVQIDRIGLLAILYESIAIPPVVLAELTASGAPSVVQSWASSLPAWILVNSPDGHWGEKGEQSAIALALQLGCPLLCDDKPARRQAVREGLLVTGTLGVLQEASICGMIDLRQDLQKLIQVTNFHAGKGLIEQVIREVETTLRRREL